MQLSPDESRGLLDLLFNLVVTRPVLNCRVRWTPNTLVFWDNRCTQHHDIWDYYPHERYGQRASINGTAHRLITSWRVSSRRTARLTHTPTL